MKLRQWTALAVLALVVAVLTVGCNSTAPQTCTLTIKFIVSIRGAKNNPDRAINELKLQTVRSSNSWVISEADKPKIQSWIDNNRAKVASFNDAMKALFGPLPEYITIPQLADDYPWNPIAPEWQTYDGTCSGRQRADLSYSMQENTTSKYGYTTSIRLDQTDAFVTVLSPKGSQVAFKMPASLINDTLAAALEGNAGKAKEAVTLNYVLRTPKVDVSRSDFEQALIQNLIDSRDNGTEAVSFSLNAGDFEGRTILKSVIARGLQITANGKGPVTAVINGYLGNGATVISSLRFDSGGIGVTGFWILGTGIMAGGGGGTHYQQSSQTTFDDVVRGSIYIK